MKDTNNISRIFDYSGVTSFRFTGPESLLERIACNLESEVDCISTSACTIALRLSDFPQQITTNTNLPYLSIENSGTMLKPIIKYFRYDTHVRTICQIASDHYEVDVNVNLDEGSGLIPLRNVLSRHELMSQYPLLHASLVKLGGRGILIPGDSKQGKTTLAVYLIQEQGAEFVGDENIIIETSSKMLRGIYVPRTPRVRFSTIANCGLSRALTDISLTNATQYIDSEAIRRIIQAKKFDVDAGMAFSRTSFCNLLGTASQESSQINTILFPIYSKGNGVVSRELGVDEGVKRLGDCGLARKRDIDPKELGNVHVGFSREQLFGVNFIEVEFSGLKSLIKAGFRI